MSPTLKYKEAGVFTSTGGGDDDVVTVDPYVRPADWLTLPTVLSSDQKFVGLHAVYDHESNFVALNCAGAYTVDWGDGTASENIAANTAAYHNFVYSALSSGTLCSRGYRQAIVTITPQAGQNLTKVDLFVKHNQAGLVSSYTSGWLDIRMAGSAVSTLVISSSASTVRHRILEQFEYVGTSAITGLINLFNGCFQLRSVIGTDWTASVTSFSSMFQSCLSLRTIPLINTAAGTTFQSIFQSCSSLQTIPLLNTAAGTNFSSMFSSCLSLRTIPLLDTAAGMTFQSMFSGCSSLLTIPLLNTAAGTTFSSMFNGCAALLTIPLLNTAASTSFTSMFNNCSSLQTIPLLNTAAGTSFQSMFNGCAALLTIPLLNTAASTSFTSMFNNCSSLQTIPLLNTAAGTTFFTMFNGCAALLTIPLLNTAAGIDFGSMFASCSSLQTIPLINTAAGTVFNSMFSGCSSLQTIPLLNMAAAGNLGVSGMFTGCTSLRVGAMAGTRSPISYASCALGPAALDAIYTNLATLNNMLSINAASAETSVADWATNVVNCNVTRGSVGSAAPDGNWTVRMTSIAAGVMTAAITTRIAVSPSTQYTFLAKGVANASTRPGRVAIAWYDAGGALISTSTGVDVTFSTTSTSYLQAIVTTTSPANAATASLVLSATASSANQIVDWDTMGLFLGAVTAWVPPAGSQTITVTSNWGVAADTPSIATAKGWTVTGS